MLTSYATPERSASPNFLEGQVAFSHPRLSNNRVGVDQYSRLPAPGSRLPAPGIVDAAGRPDVRVRTLPAPASARIAG
ncbi:hypothetical protein STEG23_016923 [Scotinomys teguina]